MYRIVWYNRSGDPNPEIFISGIIGEEQRLLAKRIVYELNRQMADWLNIDYRLEPDA